MRIADSHRVFDDSRTWREIRIEGVPYSRDEEESALVSWIFTARILQHIHDDIAGNHLNHQEVIEDVANHRELDGSGWDVLVNAYSTGIEHDCITVVESPDNISDEVAVIGLLSADFRKASFQRNHSIPHNPFALLFELVQLLFYKLFEVLIVVWYFIDSLYGQLIAEFMALVG